MDQKPPFSGKVKEYTLQRYNFDDNSREVLESKYTWKYDRNNILCELQHYNDKNEIVDISSYEYDGSGKLVEIIVKAADGSEKQTITYEYEDGRLSRVTDTTSEFKIVTGYDDYGSPLEKHNFQDNETTPMITKYINLYDQDNRLVEKRTIFPSGGAEWIDMYTYSDEGQLIEEIRTRNGVNSITRYSYNEKGDRVLSEYDPGQENSETVKNEIVYNKEGDIFETREYRKGWCYQNYNDEFGLVGVSRYTYVR